MVKALVSLTTRIVCVHRDMTPLISRIHTGFMIQKNLQAVEHELKTMQEMLQEIRTTLDAPKPTNTTILE